MSNSLTIGERISVLRKKKKLSQSDLANLTGKSRSGIAQIETGGMKPDYEFIRDIVRIFNTTYEYVFGEEIDPSREKGVTYLDQNRGNLKGNLIDDPKNDLYIKSTEKGVEQSGEKGGRLKGSLIDDSPNEMHIKPPKKGVRIESEKGGKDWGQDYDDFGNEIHTKQAALSEGVRFMRTGYRNSVAEKAVEIFSDDEKPLYGDLRQHYELLMSGQNKLMRAILDRLDKLERKLEQQEAPPPHTGEGADLG